MSPQTMIHTTGGAALITVSIAVDPGADQAASAAIHAEQVVPKMTTLRELAEMLKMDRSAARRYVMRLGFEPKRGRTASSGYQTALVFTPDQVHQIVQARTADGYC